MQLNKVSNWCSANKLTINLLKTNYMIISGNRQSVTTQGYMQIANTVINKVDVASFVGLNIDQHLTWKFHIEKVNKCVRKKM